MWYEGVATNSPQENKLIDLIDGNDIFFITEIAKDTMKRSIWIGRKRTGKLWTSRKHGEDIAHNRDTQVSGSYPKVEKMISFDAVLREKWRTDEKKSIDK